MLVGLAMLAMPLTAAAEDHNFHAQNNHAAHAAARNYARAVRNGAVAPGAVRDFRAERAFGNAGEYRNYGRAYNYNRGYYGAPGYVGAPGYAAPYYGGGVPGYAVGNGCGRAQSVMNQYYRDRNYGHPAAANDLLRQNQWAFRSGCAGGAPVGGGFGGLGGLFGGAPAYNNYRPAYNGGGLGGLFGGAPAYNNNYRPAYNGGGYNGGYGQPGGSSMLGPLIQRYFH